jgi:hypothetical protein
MITIHTRERIFGRLKDIVTEHDVFEMVQASEHFTSGKHYVNVRNLNAVHWTDDSIGDTIVCVIQDGNVKTAMLSFASQRWEDGEYWRVNR